MKSGSIAAVLLLAICGGAFAGDEAWLPEDYALRNLAQHVFPGLPRADLPIKVAPFEEQVRVEGLVISREDAEGAWTIGLDADGKPQLITERPSIDDHPVNAIARTGDTTWYATDRGLFFAEGQDAPARHEHYGIDGPLATRVTALAADSAGALWAGAPSGLSRRAADGTWTHVRGSDGLPVESITALACTPNGEVWIGTEQGAILYRPEAEGRKWFYRAGRRYLPDDHVRAIVPARDNSAVYFLTEAGVSVLELRSTTLLARAQKIESLVNVRHRREGMVAACTLGDKWPAGYNIHDNDNDGLWTAYHVAAMSLCYGATHDPAAKASAREGMHALYMLQTISGTPGLVARSVLPVEEGKKRGPQWRPADDGVHYWKSDTSSDEIDGHYLAFYAYYEHIAKDDPEERALIDKQVRAVTDYIVDHGYQLIDWTGKRTTWGFWDPKSLNENPSLWDEAGLNSLQMLSFLKVAAYITNDAKYQEHFRSLAVDHHYLENVMRVKHAFPEENNHSDDQLGFVAWYPILQLERDPKARQALLRGVRHHYEVVRDEQPSFYTFVYATIDPGHADLDGAVENLRQIPTDRRTWQQKNSHRADITVNPRPNRFKRKVITRVLPADERVFEKWNADPYVPDGGTDGSHEDDGSAYLLPYWMGRYHGFIAEQE